MLCTCSHAPFQHNNGQRCEFCECLSYAAPITHEKPKAKELKRGGTGGSALRNLGRIPGDEWWTQALWRQRNSSSALVRFVVSAAAILALLFSSLLFVGPAWLLNLWLIDHGIDVEVIAVRFGAVVGNLVGALVGVVLWLGLLLGFSFAMFYGVIVAGQFLYVALRRKP